MLIKSKHLIRAHETCVFSNNVFFYFCLLVRYHFAVRFTVECGVFRDHRILDARVVYLCFQIGSKHMVNIRSSKQSHLMTGKH